MNFDFYNFSSPSRIWTLYRCQKIWGTSKRILTWNATKIDDITKRQIWDKIHAKLYSPLRFCLS